MRFALSSLCVLVLACTAGPEPPTTASVGAVERVVIDTRPPGEFAAGHVPGAINLQLGWDQLEARVAAYVPDRSTGVSLRCQDSDAAADATSTLTELGYGDLLVFEPENESSVLELWHTERLAEALQSPNPPVVIDVRSRAEQRTQTIPGALLFEQDEAPAQISELDREARYVIVCEAGWRSSQLASYMRREGFHNVVNMIDGVAGWRSR